MYIWKTNFYRQKYAAITYKFNNDFLPSLMRNLVMIVITLLMAFFLFTLDFVIQFNVK